MAKNTALRSAEKSKQDEFYTQLSDIEKELRHYKKHFEGKVVFCNCDDPYESDFFKYFAINFNRLKIKKLICTSYVSSPIRGTIFEYFDDEDSDDAKRPYKAVVTKVHDVTGDGAIDMFDIAELFKMGENHIEELQGDGDFRSEECVELLRESDIVVTNPPFSLFREYISLLLREKKFFIIIGSQNAITYQEIFPLLKDNVLWLGYGNGDMSFRVPNHFEPRETRFWIDENGQKWRSMGNIAWFTNLDIRKRHEELILVKKYDSSNYPKYDNYDAINVDKVVDIPCDYAGTMGVPITFMYKYNPDQFEIINALNRYVLIGEEALNEDIRIRRSHACNINGKATYFRILIRNRNPEGE